MRACRGLFPPLFTPFQPDGRSDEKGLREHVDWVIALGSVRRPMRPLMDQIDVLVGAVVGRRRFADGPAAPQAA